MALELEIEALKQEKIDLQKNNNSDEFLSELNKLKDEL